MNGEEIVQMIEAREAFLVTPREMAVQAVVLGAVVGGTVGFLAYRQGQRVTAAKYEEIMAQEIADAKAFYAKLNKEGMETPQKAKEVLHPEEEEEELLDEAVSAVKKYQGGYDDSLPDSRDIIEDSKKLEEEMRKPPDWDEEDRGVTVILDDHSDEDPDWDWEREYELRAESPDKPYIIHLEEWMVNEFGFDQTTLTYYNGDHTLADEREEAIPYSDPIIGDHNLERWGAGSGDPHTILIRNERLSTDFEVSFVEGKYAHEVLGLEHSDGGARARQRRNELRKFRDDPR